MVEDWLANAYEGMSRRQFLARMTAAGVGLAGFAIAANPVAGEVITTPTDGLTVADGNVASGGFQVPIYEARPATAGKYPVVLVIPEVFGMHEHIKDVTRRFAKEGFLSITFEPYAREGGVLQLPDIESVRKVVDPVPDDRVMGDLDAIVAYAKQHPAARPDQIGVTGFCRGGMYTLLFAAHSREMKAAVPWYGQLKPAKTPGVRTVGPLDVASRDQCARPRSVRRGGSGHPCGRRQRDGGCPQGIGQDSRVCDLSGSAPRVLRGLPAQLPARGSQGRLGPLRGVVQQIPQRLARSM